MRLPPVLKSLVYFLIGTGCCVHCAVYKQAVDHEILTLALHLDSLLAVDCGVAALFHPIRDVNVPSAGCLSGSIDALEELKAVAFSDGFRPPVLSGLDIYHVVPHAAVQQGLASVCLVDRSTLSCCNCQYQPSLLRL